MYTTHRTVGSVIPVAVRHVSPKSLLPQGEVGGKSGRLNDGHSELVEWQWFVFVGTTVARLRDNCATRKETRAVDLWTRHMVAVHPAPPSSLHE